MRYYVLYPKAENVHLIKDVGMIAYKLHKLYGYNSYIASYNNDKYYYLDEEVKGIKMDFIQKKNKNLINIFKYLSKNSKNIDVLQIFHMTFNSVVYALLYKFFNRRGIIFLKLDCTELILQKIKNMKSIERIFFNFFLSSVDIIGVEQKYIFDRLKYLIGKHSNKLINVPNGIDFEADYFKKDINFKDKENIILNVGRIGSSEKATDLLMKAFSLIDEEIRKEWKLVFVGPVEDSFKETIEDFFEKYPNIKADIIFKGPIFNREELFQEYKKSKIFCLTSAYESFGIALIEAIACGNVIVSTRVGIAEEIVKEGKGAVVNVGDYKAIAVELKKLMTSDNLDKYSEEMKKYCKKQYNWDNIVENLHYRINNIRGKDDMNIDPKVFIVILNFNSFKDTKECLFSLKQLKYSNHEIIVVDNSSTDGSYEKLKREFSTYNIIKCNENLGYASGNNLGIKYALKNNAEYICILNNDVIVESDFLDKIIEIMEEHKEIGVAGPCICKYNNKNIIQAMGAKINLYTGLTQGKYKNYKYNEIPKENSFVDYLGGACFVCRRDVFEDIGLIPENYFLFFEETEFCYRASAKGYKLLCVYDSKIYHKGSSTISKYSGLSYYFLNRNRVIFIKRNANMLEKTVFSIYIFIEAIGRIIIRREPFSLIKNIIHGFKADTENIDMETVNKFVKYIFY